MINARFPIVGDGAINLVIEAGSREYVIKPDPEAVDEFCPDLDKPYLDGRFSADELEAMAWCMRNGAWPKC